MYVRTYMLEKSCGLCVVILGAIVERTYGTRASRLKTKNTCEYSTRVCQLGCGMYRIMYMYIMDMLPHAYSLLVHRYVSGNQYYAALLLCVYMRTYVDQSWFDSDLEFRLRLLGINLSLLLKVRILRKQKKEILAQENTKDSGMRYIIDKNLIPTFGLIISSY